MEDNYAICQFVMLSLNNLKRNTFSYSNEQLGA